MLIVSGIILSVTLSGLAVVANSLRKAPEGYEDEQGFHRVVRTSGSAILRRKSIRESGAAALKRIRAHS
jgi:hypothetical protein